MARGPRGRPGRTSANISFSGVAGPGKPRGFPGPERGSKIRVTRGEHRGEPRGLFFAPALLARLFKMPMVTYNLQRPFPVDLFLQSPQGLVDGLAFFKLNFGQNSLTSSLETLGWSGLHGRHSSLVRPDRLFSAGLLST